MTDQRDSGTAVLLRKGEGEILKVRFGNSPEFRVIAEYKLTNMGNGWHLNRTPVDNSNGHLAFLGDVPWAEVERLALKFVDLMEQERLARRELHAASGKVGTLIAEIKGKGTNA